MCSFFIPPPSFGMVEAGIYRCTLPNPLSQVLPIFFARRIWPECTSQPFIADLLSPRAASSGPGTILYLAEDAPPDFLLSFAEDNSIRIGKQYVLFYQNVSPDSCRDRSCCKRRYSTTAGAFDLERKRGAPSIYKSHISANHPLFDRRSTSCTDCWTLGCSLCF
jgi:hypothetical protein